MSPPSRIHSRNITAILTEAGVVTDEQVQAGLASQRESGLRIGEALVELKFATEEDIGWALARQLELPFVDIPVEVLDLKLLASFSTSLLHRLEAVPLVKTDTGLSIALADPTDATAIAELEEATQLPVAVSVATPTAIRRALREALGVTAFVTPHRSHGSHSPEPTRERSGASFLASQVSRAQQAGASEIHFVPYESGLRVFHRIGRALTFVSAESLETLTMLMVRIGALGGDAVTSEHHACTILCPLADTEVPLEVSILPHGGMVSVRLGLGPMQKVPRTLDGIGLDPVDVGRLRNALDGPGLVLVLGPVGAGRSATLSAMLDAVAAEGRRGLVFSEAVRLPAGATSWTRVPHLVPASSWIDVAVGQNADVVVLDDTLRDEAIATLASSAGSGRIVIASVEWTDSFSLIAHLAATPQGGSALADRLRCVLQVRRVIGATPAEPGAPSGRLLFEPLFITDAMREPLRSGNTAELRRLAAADGFRSIAERARAAVEAGIIDAAEAARAAS